MRSVDALLEARVDLSYICAGGMRIARFGWQSTAGKISGRDGVEPPPPCSTLCMRRQ